MEDFPVFTLEEANYKIPEVIRVTEEAIARLEEIKEPYERLGFRKFNPIHNLTDDDLVKVEWARQIAALGVYPKGYFIVDFQSPDADTFYCWKYGETDVSHEHKKWETFVDRRRIRSNGQGTDRTHGG